MEQSVGSEHLDGTSSVKLSRMMSNYESIYKECIDFSNSCTRLVNTHVYYLVFKPYDEKYEEYKDSIITRGMDNVGQWLRKRTHSFAYILTREIIATKCHYNAIVFSTNSYLADNWNGSTVARKYKCHAQLCYNIPKLLTYILKEAQQREPYILHDDYAYKKYLLNKLFIDDSSVAPITAQAQALADGEGKSVPPKGARGSEGTGSIAHPRHESSILESDLIVDFS